MWYVILTAAGAIGGAVGMFLFIRNNPKYIKIEALGKDKLQALIDKANEALKK